MNPNDWTDFLTVCFLGILTNSLQIYMTPNGWLIDK